MNHHSPPIFFESQLNGGMTMGCLKSVAIQIAQYLSDQTCPNSNILGLNKRGAPVPVCEGTSCIVVNGILAMRVASQMQQYRGSWLSVSTISPSLTSDLNPGWLELRSNALDNDLFPTLDTLASSVRDAKLETISKWFFGASLEVHGKPDAGLTNFPITFDQYTCSPQPTNSAATTSKCPKMSATFTSPVTTVSTFVCPTTVVIQRLMSDIFLASTMWHSALQLGSHQYSSSILGALV